MSERKRGGAALIVIGLTVVAMLTVAYVLSTGPAFCLCEAGYISQETMQVVYRPLGWLVDHSPTACQKAMAWYIGFWRSGP